MPPPRILAHDVQRRVVRAEQAPRVPHVVDPRQLHPVLERTEHVGLELDRRRRGAHHLGPARDAPEPALHLLAGLDRIDVPGDHQHRVVGRVVRPEEAPHVLERGRLQVGHRADDRPAVRVLGRVEALEDVLLGESVGPVLVGLPALVLHHALLQLHLLGSDLGHQESHAVRVQIEHQRQGVRGAILVVVGAVLGGRPVVVGSRGFEQAVELPGRHVLRAHEHQVLEQVGEAGPPRLLISGSHVVPDVHADDGQRVVLVQDDLEAVGQRERGVRDAQRAGRPEPARCGDDRQQREPEGHAAE